MIAFASRSAASSPSREGGNGTASIPRSSSFSFAKTSPVSRLATVFAEPPVPSAASNQSETVRSAVSTPAS